jgi:MFS family permease
VIPAHARGAGFGLLTTASLIGMAASPVISGFLGATSIRAVFGLDIAALAMLALIVRRARPTSGAPPVVTEGVAQEPMTENL